MPVFKEVDFEDQFGDVCEPPPVRVDMLASVRDTLARAQAELLRASDKLAGMEQNAARRYKRMTEYRV